MELLKGIPTSSGISIGEVFVIEKEEFIVEKRIIDNSKTELLKFHDAVQSSVDELELLINNSTAQLSDDEKEVLEAHQSILIDVDFNEKVEELVNKEKHNVEYAIQEVTKEYVALLSSLDDDYMRARIKDIEEVYYNLILIISQKKSNIILDKPAIIVSEDIATNTLAALNKSLLKGIITSKGGSTDHTSIICKALGIPLITAIGGQIEKIENKTKIIMNGGTGEIYTKPDSELLSKFTNELERQNRTRKENLSESSKLAYTKSGRLVKIYANVGSIAEAKIAFDNGADGIGLLRTELCFLETTKLPSEEEHYSIYKDIVKNFPSQEVIIRLMDFGSDKEIPFLKTEAEANPALGLRALRLGYLHYDNLLKPQIRAILRLSLEFNIKILCPMIACLEDYIEIKTSIINERNILEKEGLIFKTNTEIGIMVEVPNVAITAVDFVKEVDFFSIGTNDLAQYLMAADRTNPAVAVKYLELANPTIIKLIGNLIKEAKKEEKPVSICGELAANKDLSKVFIDLEVDELSISPSLIPELKAHIREQN